VFVTLLSATTATAGRTVLIEAPKNGWEDPPEPSPETFSEETAPDERSTPRRRRVPLIPLLAALLVAGLVAAAVLGWQYRDARRTETARAEALTAAQKAAPIVLSYDYRRLDKDFAAARAHLTGDFRDEYGKTTKAVVGPTAQKYHGVVKATVAAPATGAPAASVVSASPDKVVVLLFVNQVTESTQVSGARVDLNRVRMTMSRTDSGWRVSAVDAL
jgi:Mce-associated membrane protein